MESDIDVATKLPRVGVYLKPELKADLEEVAEKEQRSLSNLIAVILQRYIDELKGIENKPDVQDSTDS